MEVSVTSTDRKRSAPIRRALLRWYDKNGRRFAWRKASARLYEKIVAEVLLQRTRAATVNLYFRSFIKRFPGWNALAAATPGEIGDFLKPVGLWRRRANSLSQLAIALAKRRGKFPATRVEIESLPGVGQYIASAVFIFSQGKPEPLLDGSMARVIERIFGPRRLVDIRYDPHLQAHARLLVAGPEPAKINWAILDLAAIVCTSTPRCQLCPVRKWCDYANSQH